jgi:hypothetical protein
MFSEDLFQKIWAVGAFGLAVEPSLYRGFPLAVKFAPTEGLPRSICVKEERASDFRIAERDWDGLIENERDSLDCLFR